MSFLDDYRNRASGDTSTFLENNYKRIITDSFKNNPSYYEIYINDGTELIPVWITDDSQVKEQKNIVTHPDYNLLSNGDIITWKNTKWLNIITDNMSDIYYRGIIRECVSSIKWIDSSGTIQESYFVLDTSYDYGLNEGKVISIPDEQRKIIIKKDDNSVKLTKGKRFIFDNRCWKITGINTLYDGLIYLTLVEDLIDPSKDNVDLRICDYIQNDYTIEIVGGDIFSINLGETLQLTSNVYNNGDIVDVDVTYSSSDETIVTVDNSGLVTSLANGNVTVDCNLVGDVSVKDSVEVNIASVITNNYSINISGSDSIFISFSEVYNAEVLNNGDAASGENVTWELLDENNNSTTIASFISQDDVSCEIKGDIKGIFYLKCTLVSDNSISAIKQIDVDSLI